jgi:hypothetical protein
MKIPEWCPFGEQESKLGRHVWKVARLVQLARDLPVIDVPVDHLCVWRKYDGLTMRELVMHMKAVNDADLKYPIILDEDGDIMDGCHRIMKTILSGGKTIKAVRFDENPDPDRIIDE